jgi:hypothetical protein
MPSRPPITATRRSASPSTIATQRSGAQRAGGRGGGDGGASIDGDAAAAETARDRGLRRQARRHPPRRHNMRAATTSARVRTTAATQAARLVDAPCSKSKPLAHSPHSMRWRTTCLALLAAFCVAVVVATPATFCTARSVVHTPCNCHRNARSALASMWLRCALSRCLGCTPGFALLQLQLQGVPHVRVRGQVLELQVRPLLV